MTQADKIFTTAHIPSELKQKYMQYIRDFDVNNPGCHFEIAIDTPEISLTEAIAQLQVNPELRFRDIFERKEK